MMNFGLDIPDYCKYFKYIFTKEHFSTNSWLEDAFFMEFLSLQGLRSSEFSQHFCKSDDSG